MGQHIQHTPSIGKYQHYITVQFQAFAHRWRLLCVLIHQKTCLAYASLNVILSTSEILRLHVENCCIISCKNFQSAETFLIIGVTL